MRSRRFRNVHVKYIEPAAAHFVPRALDLLDQCRDGGNRMTGYKRRVIGDVTITVWYAAGNGFIDIRGGGCPDLQSGLLDPQPLTATVFAEPSPGADLVEMFSQVAFKAATPAFQNSPKLTGIAPEIIEARPAFFSGTMRAVCQDFISRNNAIPYSYTYAKTHGIFLNSEGRPFVIEISAEGVFAWPLRTCKSRSKLMGGLTFLPLPTPKPEDPITLATGLGIAGVYTATQSVFPGCGWAFSYSGAKASNVLLTVSGAYYRSKIVTINILENSDTKRPASISIEEGAEDWFYTTRATHFKYPDYVQGCLMSFDAYTALSGPAAEYDCPVMVWYEGEELKEVRYLHTSSVSEPVNTAPPTDTVTGSLGSWYVGTAMSNRTGFYCPGMPDPYTAESFSGTRYSRFITKSFGICSTGGYNAFYSFTTLVSVCTLARNGAVTEGTIEICAATYGDRESVALFREKSQDDAGGNENQACTCGALGEGCEACHSLGGGAFGVVAITFCLGNPSSSQCLRGCYPIHLNSCVDRDDYSFFFSGGLAECDGLEDVPEDENLPDFCEPNRMHCLDTCAREFNCYEDSFSSRSYDPETVMIRSGFIRSGGAVYAMDDAYLEDDSAQWRAFIEEPVTQAVFSAPDFSGSIEPIRSKRLWTGQVQVGQAVAGPSPYPIADISRGAFCWIGTPGVTP